MNTYRSIRRLLKQTAAAALICGTIPTAASAISLKEAVSVTLDSNPEIGEAIENREAIEFELRQAKGLLLPSLDLEGSVGARRLDNDAREGLLIDDDTLKPAEIGVVATQKLFDGGRTRAEIDRQASRVDSASFRVMERSEYLALQVVREYLEYLLQTRILQESVKNLEFHRKIQANIGSSISGGTLTEADRQQARERTLAAQVKLTQAEEDIEAAKSRFLKLTGVPLSNASQPGSIAGSLPGSLDAALGLGRTANPRTHLANADIDAADAEVAAARADFLPELVLEGRARTGDDIDGDDGNTNDLQARVVMRWNLYRGGIKKAKEQEYVRRASEQRMRLHQTHREIEEAIRISWDRRIMRARMAEQLRQQARESALLVNSYIDQFEVGQRSLLDVLDAQNERYNTDILSKQAELASQFSGYRILAHTGGLVRTFGLQAAPQSEAYARQEFNVPETQPAETDNRVPSRQANNLGLPMDLIAPIRKR